MADEIPDEKNPNHFHISASVRDLPMFMRAYTRLWALLIRLEKANPPNPAAPELRQILDAVLDPSDEPAPTKVSCHKD
jgi:hypothetical protein